MSPARETHKLVVQSPKPPVIEFDTECGAIYVRFRTSKVAKTFDRSSESMVVTIDVDRSGDVVGIEGVGFSEFTIAGLLKAANVRAEHVDFSKAKFRATPSSVAHDMEYA